MGSFLKPNKKYYVGRKEIAIPKNDKTTVNMVNVFHKKLFHETNEVHEAITELQKDINATEIKNKELKNTEVNQPGVFEREVDKRNDDESEPDSDEEAQFDVRYDFDELLVKQEEKKEEEGVQELSPDELKKVDSYLQKFDMDNNNFKTFIYNINSEAQVINKTRNNLLKALKALNLEEEDDNI